MTTQRNLSPRQRGFVEYWATGLSVKGAAVAAQVPESTARRWARDPRVVAEVRLQQDARIEDFSRGLADLAGLALGVLREVLRDRSYPATVRLRAVGLVVDAMLRICEYQVLSQRLAELEQEVLRNHEYQATPHMG